MRADNFTISVVPFNHFNSAVKYKHDSFGLVPQKRNRCSKMWTLPKIRTVVDLKSDTFGANRTCADW